MSKKQPTYTDTFKEQIVALYHSGKSLTQLSKDYDPSVPTISRWVKFFDQSGSFREANNRTPQEKELIELRKRNLELEMENDLLHPKGYRLQAALILGRR